MPNQSASSTDEYTGEWEEVRTEDAAQFQAAQQQASATVPASKSRWVTPVLLVLAAAIIIACWWVAPRAPEGEESFAGTDATAPELVSDRTGFVPSLESPIDLGGPEVESGIFALQAALGAGTIGYVIGRVRPRK